ncbi:hypothetical protein AHAS_Ahas17G0103400 [Arachis hypogaea]
MLINVKLILAYISRLYLPSASSSTTKMKRGLKNKYTVSPPILCAWNFRITQTGNSYHRKRKRNSGWKPTRFSFPS